MNRRHLLQAFLAAALFHTTLAGLATPQAGPVDRLRATVEWLSHPDRSGRQAGSAGARASADFLADEFRKLGLDVRMQEFGRERINVIARLGSSERIIVVGSHFDGQGAGKPSASDNAAGIAVLLELARRFSPAELPVSLLFIAFDDEEQGLIGSRHYTENPVYPLEQTEAAIIMDTMGRPFVDLSESALMILGTEYSAELAGIVTRHAGERALNVGTDLIGPRSDFAPFALKKIPYLFFSNATHRDYHGSGDTSDKIRYPELLDDTGTIHRIIGELAAATNRPTFRAEPVYPAGESPALLRVIRQVREQQPQLAGAYRMMFDHLESALPQDNSRDGLRLATSVLLGAATPSMSVFLLEFFIGPAYERLGQKTVAIAVYDEALRWAAPGAGADRIRRRIESLKEQ